MADLYEYYNTGDDADYSVYGSNWASQTFTPVTAHKITSVKLLLFRFGLPGTLTVSIKATSGGLPTGGNLCSGTTDGDTLTTFETGDWREITLGAGYNLDADTMYAIVFRALDGDSSNLVKYRGDSTSPTYTRGTSPYSNNSGVDWTDDATFDCMFEDWGEPIFVLHEWEGSDGIALTDTLVKTPMKMLVDGIQFTDVTIKEFYKVLTDPIAFTDTLVKYKTMFRTFTDGIAFTDVVHRLFEKVFTDGIKFRDILYKWRWLVPTRLRQPTRTLPPTRILKPKG